MANMDFDKQIILYKLKIYILLNDIKDVGQFFIYVQTKCDDEIKTVVNANTSMFKSFVSAYAKNPEKTKNAFIREREKFMAKNTGGIERGIKLRSINDSIPV